MRRLLVITALATASVLLAACGSSSGSSHGSSMGSAMSSGEQNAPVVPGAPEITVSGKAYSFAPKRIELAAGTDANIALTSTDLPHDVTVVGVGHVVHAQAGKTARGGLRITKPGTYTFYCSVTGHRAAGMTGKIVVS